MSRATLSERSAQAVALELRARVLAYLDEHPGGHTVEALARDLGCTVNSIRAIVASLTGTGEVAVHQRGKRSYVEAAP